MENKIILAETNEYLAMSEDEAYSLIDSARDGGYEVEASSVKYKKPTAKKSEHWIVSIKIRKDLADNHVLLD